MTTSAIFDRIRIIPRPDDFLDRNVGSSGEVFFDKQANSLRLYDGKATGGYSLLTAGNFTQQIADTGVAVLEKTVTVSVDSVAGQSTGVFYINGVEKPIIEFVRGYTYVFDQSDVSNASYGSHGGGSVWHPLMFSTTENGDLVPGGLHYDQTTTDHGIIYLLDDDPVSMRYYTDNFKSATTRKVLITVQSNAPDELWYWCHFHTGQGNKINVSDPGTGSGGASISVGDTAPSNPSSGAIWFNSTTGILYVYYTDPDGSQWVQPSTGNVSLDYNNLTNKPTIPAAVTSLTDLSIVDGTAGQVLQTDGNGTFSFVNAGTGSGIVEGSNYRINIVADDSSVIVNSSTGKVPWTAIDGTPTTVSGYGITDAAGGNFTFVGSTLDTSDSSGITITPAVTMSSDLNVENDIRASNSIYAGEFVNTGAGAPEIDSATTLTLKAPDGVQVQSGAFRLASFNNAGRDALTPVNGDMIYNTQDNKIQAYINGSWRRIDDSPIV